MKGNHVDSWHRRFVPRADRTALEEKAKCQDAQTYASGDQRSVGHSLPLGLANECVEGGCKHKAKNGYPEHSEEHCGSERLPHFGASPVCNCERRHACDEREGGHQDRAQTYMGRMHSC